MTMEVSAEERRKFRLDTMKKRRAAAATTSEDAAATALKKLKTMAAEADVVAATVVAPDSNTGRRSKTATNEVVPIPKRKVDTQVRYDPPPNTNMSDDELKEWRKEQRRIRNRDSAAASRARTKDRISELEAQNELLEDTMDELCSKHSKECTAYQLKIQQLEALLLLRQAPGPQGEKVADQEQQGQGATRQECINLVSSSVSSSEGEDGDENQVGKNQVSPPSSPVLSAMMTQGTNVKAAEVGKILSKMKESVQDLARQVEDHQVQHTQPQQQQQQESPSLQLSLSSQHSRQHITEMISRTACV
jgi:hypothetical protein